MPYTGGVCLVSPNHSAVKYNYGKPAACTEDMDCKCLMLELEENTKEVSKRSGTIRDEGTDAGGFDGLHC